MKTQYMFIIRHPFSLLRILILLFISIPVFGQATQKLNSQLLVSDQGGELLSPPLELYAPIDSEPKSPVFDGVREIIEELDVDVSHISLSEPINDTGVKSQTVLSDDGYLLKGDPIDYAMNLGWASFRNISSNRFSQLFDQYSNNGYILIDIDAYTLDNNLRYAMIWRQNTDNRAWAAHRDLSSQAYGDLWTDYRDRGFRVVDQEAYMTSQGLRFAGIWVENKEGFSWSSRRNMTSDDYAEYFIEQKDLGRRIIDLEIYSTDAGIRYAAIWQANPTNMGWAAFREMTRTSYQEKVDELSAQGFWVIDYEAYDTPNGIRYAAIWEPRPTGKAIQVRTNRTEIDFANLWRQYSDEGYRLLDFEYNDTPNGPRYSGIWIENSDRYRYPLKGQIDNTITQYLQANNLPGISVAVVLDGQTVYRRGFGFADLEEGKVAHSRTVYNSASVSKVVGGTLAAKLEANGQLVNGTPIQLDLSNATSTYLTNLPGAHTHQVDELLAHLGCIPHYDTSPGIANQTTHYNSATAAAPSIWGTLLNNCTTGTTRSYSTHAFTLVGAVLEQVSGRNVTQLVRDEIAIPYGLNSFRAQFTENSLPANYERAVPYNDDNTPSSYSNNSWKVLGGGIEMDVLDLARFGWQTLSGQIVSPEVRDDRLWAAVRNNCGASTFASCQNGLGWARGVIDNRRIVEHGGDWTGARSHLRIYRDNGLVIAVLSNNSNHSPANLVTSIGDIILPFTTHTDETGTVSKSDLLQQNYPNPASSFTNITYSVPTSNFVQLRVHDINGRVVLTPVKQIQTTGDYTIVLPLDKLPAGIYVYTLQIGQSQQSRRMIVR
jgi:CubicO group peptidase (beta-lactamase class C family)